MINLRTSSFADIMPENLASQTEVRAIAYALGRQIAVICAYADSARVYAAVSQIPEAVLDALAAELRTPAYDENYSISVKRALVKGTLTFYMKMGTPYAVGKIIEAVFGGGGIEEWFNYGGEPYHFKAYTTNPAVDDDDAAVFIQALSTVKRLSAWLDEIILRVHRAYRQRLVIGYTGATGAAFETQPVMPEYVSERRANSAGGIYCHTHTQSRLIG